MIYENKYTYTDQEFVEIYDNYDLQESEVPKMILEAPIIKERNLNRVVRIDYLDNGVWDLNGSIGKAPFYEEAGKKAFVRGGKYKHPVKGWKSQISYMTAYEYIEMCARMFSRRGGSATPESIIDQRLKDYDMEKVFGENEGDIFYPVIDFKGKGQEGLHRAVWFMMKYDEEPMPVIIIWSK
jgi:hypothetical protein